MEGEPQPLPAADRTMNYDNVPHATICGKAPVGLDGPQEMDEDDRRGFALFEINSDLDQIAREERWTITSVEPDDVVAPAAT